MNRIWPYVLKYVSDKYISAKTNKHNLLCKTKYQTTQTEAVKKFVTQSN